MNESVLETCRKWYDDYARSYRSGDLQLEDAVQLKYEHTMRVCSDMEQLCESISLTGNHRRIVLIAALLHDVARFEQFRIFRTFSDRKSVNHAELALLIISKNGLLAGLAPGEAEAVLCAVRHHSAIAVPDFLDDERKLFCRLLRDADKLDIYRIALDHYIKPDPRRRETVQVGIPDGETVSPEMCNRILNRETVPYEMIQTVTDFKMIQLGWVFDLNFHWSFKKVKERGYIGAIGKQLPQTPGVVQVIEMVERYIEKRVAEPAAE